MSQMKHFINHLQNKKKFARYYTVSKGLIRDKAVKIRKLQVASHNLSLQSLKLFHTVTRLRKLYIQWTKTLTKALFKLLKHSRFTEKEGSLIQK